MLKHRLLTGIAAAGFAGLAATTASAETTSETDQLRSELATLRSEIAQLRQEQNEDWLTERRAEEVKALVRDVLSDADTRSSLLAEGAYMGITDKGKVTLESANGNFKMNIGGQLQMRYTINFRDDEDNSLEDAGKAGFSIRRAKVVFSGHVASPKIKYKLQLDTNDDTNSASLDVAKISYKVADGLSIWAGEDKAPFLKEEMTSSKRQLAVERSYLNEMFTLDAIQGFGVNWEPTDNIKTYFAVHDGSQSGDGRGGPRFADLSDNISEPIDPDGDLGSGKDFDNDEVNFAVLARVEWLAAGEWKQGRDFTSFAGEDMFLMIGAAVDYESGEKGTNGVLTDDVLAYTADVMFSVDGFNAYAAFVGASIIREDASGNDDLNPFGFLVQAGYNIDFGDNGYFEPFVRYEYIDFDEAVMGYEDQISFITTGVNWYHRKHNSKLSADVVIALDPVDDGQDSLGILGDNMDADSQVAVRLQYQVLF